MQRTSMRRKFRIPSRLTGEQQGGKAKVSASPICCFIGLGAAIKGSLS